MNNPLRTITLWLSLILLFSLFSEAKTQGLLLEQGASAGFITFNSSSLSVKKSFRTETYNLTSMSFGFSSRKSLSGSTEIGIANNNIALGLGISKTTYSNLPVNLEFAASWARYNGQSNLAISAILFYDSKGKNNRIIPYAGSLFVVENKKLYS